MDGLLNADMSPNVIEKTVRLEEDSRIILHNAAEKLKLSARAYHRVLRVARTIADLDMVSGAAGEEITKAHIAEALSYRPLRLA